MRTTEFGGYKKEDVLEYIDFLLYKMEILKKEKSELEERIQNERNQFDKQLEDHTQKELNDIHKGLNRQMDEILARQNRKNQTAIEELKKDFEEKHTAYAEKIVRRIIEG